MKDYLVMEIEQDIEEKQSGSVVLCNTADEDLKEWQIELAHRHAIEPNVTWRKWAEVLQLPCKRQKVYE